MFCKTWLFEQITKINSIEEFMSFLGLNNFDNNFVQTNLKTL